MSDVHEQGGVRRRLIARLTAASVVVHRADRIWRSTSLLLVLTGVLMAGGILASCSSGVKSSASTKRSSTTYSTTVQRSLGTASTTPPPITTSPKTGTGVVIYNPFTAQGIVAPTLHVTKDVSGTCVGSGVAGNSSYRCFAQSGIYDPCFAKPGARSGPLLCVRNPVSLDVVQFSVASLPAATGGAPGQRLWAMELSNGQVCVLVSAAWGGLGPFDCSAATPGPLADCHVPEQATRWWSAACQQQNSDASPFTTYRLRRVWT